MLKRSVYYPERLFFILDLTYFVILTKVFFYKSIDLETHMQHNKKCVVKIKRNCLAEYEDVLNKGLKRRGNK